jgi:hypothetical protein
MRKLCLKTIPVIKRHLQLSFLPVLITQFLSLARFVCLEALRIAKHGTFRALSSICRVGGVHPDQSDSRNVGERKMVVNDADANPNKQVGRNDFNSDHAAGIFTGEDLGSSEKKRKTSRSYCSTYKVER